MKNAFTVLFATTFALLFISADRAKDLACSKTTSSITSNLQADSIEISTLVNISRKDFEKKLGRKLGLFERMALKKAKKKYRQNPDWMLDEQKVPTDAVLASIFSAGGLFVVFSSIASGFGCYENCPGGGGAILGLLAMLIGGILGVVALNKINKDKEKWKGGCFAIAAIGIVVCFLLLLLYVAIVGSI